jgi:3-oxoacyl-[acyl-carrier protein] reductase
MKAKDRKFEEIKVGDDAFFKKVVTEEDVIRFADLSGDQSPLHIEGGYAAATEFGGRIVHGMFLGALVSRLIGMELPGRRALILKQSLEFKKPVRIGDELTISGSVSHKSEAGRLIEVVIRINNGAIMVASGLTSVKVLE